jgi:8-amino-7-oxononanoate synthase
MGTLSKAAGGYGGYLCTRRSAAELVRNRARSYVYSTGLPPATVAAASKALELIEHDAALVERPLALARLFTRTLALPDAESPIVPLRLGAPERALAASRQLEQEGFLVKAIRPPTVSPGTSRLRFAFSAVHTEEDVLRLAAAVARLLESGGKDPDEAKARKEASGQRKAEAGREAVSIEPPVRTPRRGSHSRRHRI